jgi:hypothetical protein
VSERRLLKQVVEQRRFSAAEETGDDRDWDLRQSVTRDP